MQNTEEKLAISADVLQKATAVGPHATIQSVRLVNVSAMLGEAPPGSMKYARQQRGYSFTRAPGDMVEVDIRFTLDIATTEEERNEPPISIEGKYRLSYRIEGLASLDDEHLQAFTQVNGFFNAWPFWRELTSSMLARTQVGFFLLPTLRVTASDAIDAAAKS